MLHSENGSPNPLCYHQNLVLFDLTMASSDVSVSSLAATTLIVRKDTSLTGRSTSLLSTRVPPPNPDPASVPYTLLGKGRDPLLRDSRTRKVTGDGISRQSPGVPEHMHYFSGGNLEQQLLAFGNISLSECCARYFLVLSNMYARHNAGRMCGDILLAECSSAFSGLWCRRTVLGGEPSGRLGCRCTGAPRIPHSDLRNPVCELYRPGGRWNSRVSRPCGRSGSRRCAVWILGVVPSGLSPHGVASFVHARLELRRLTVEWSAIHRVPAPHLFSASGSAPCALTPRGCDRLPGGLSRCGVSTGSPELRRLAARVRRAVAWIRGAWLGKLGSAAALLPNLPDQAPVPERGTPQEPLE